MHWVSTALMTLITGLTLLGVAGVLCLIVKGVRFAVNPPVLREKQVISNAD
jgi:multisubunit Na+/H+ antiporter MnhC subunit